MPFEYWLPLIGAFGGCRISEASQLHLTDIKRFGADVWCRIVKELTGRGVVVRFHKENLEFTGDDSRFANLMLSMLGAVAEFERSIILERQRGGIAIAKADGRYKGRKPALTAERVKELRQRAAGGEKKTALAREFGISRQTLYANLETCDHVSNQRQLVA